ncbi:MAG: hypothetical protein ACRBEE_07855 [Arenicella sp.]
MRTNHHRNDSSVVIEREDGAGSHDNATLSIAKLLGVGILMFWMIGVVIDGLLKKPESKKLVYQMKTQLQDLASENICPSLPVWQLSSKICYVKEERDEIRQQVSQIPDIKTALSLLQWQGQSEQEAVIFSVLVSAIVNGGWTDYGDSKEPWSMTQKVLLPLWKDYPQTIALSRCYYCRYHASNLFEWYNSQPELHNELLVDIASTTPHQLNNLHKRLAIEGQALLPLVQLHSRLAFLGNREYFHAKVLREQKDLRHTLALIRNTSSAAPFWEVDLNTVPQDLVKYSWEQGVRNLDDHPKFTRHLVASGHKPALRWLIWMLDDVEYFPNLRKMKSLRGQYQAILDQYTEGEANAASYSENWDNIFWDANKQKWIF